MHNFKKLNVYQKSLDFITKIYKITKQFPKEEIFGLSSQIRRASTSISLNIAEGSGNKSNKEFKRFLEFALRSVYEVITCLEVAKRLDYYKCQELDKMSCNADEIVAMLVGLTKSLK